jgi:hypothetical protein
MTPSTLERNCEELLLGTASIATFIQGRSGQERGVTPPPGGRCLILRQLRAVSATLPKKDMGQDRASLLLGSTGRGVA